MVVVVAMEKKNKRRSEKRHIQSRSHMGLRCRRCGGRGASRLTIRRDGQLTTHAISVALMIYITDTRGRGQGRGYVAAKLYVWPLILPSAAGRRPPVCYRLACCCSSIIQIKSGTQSTTLPVAGAHKHSVFHYFSTETASLGALIIHLLAVAETEAENQ